MKAGSWTTATLLVGLLVLAGCGTNQIISNLELAVSAVQVALPLVGPSAGLPADTQAQIEKYLEATDVAIGQASDILASSATDATKAAQITAAFAGIAVPAVPAKYQGIASAVQQVAVLVSRFLGGLPVASTQPIAVRSSDRGGVESVGVRPRAALPGATVVSDSDRQRLAAIKKKTLN